MKTFRHFIFLTILTILIPLFLTASNAKGEDNTPSADPGLNSRIDTLDRKVEELEKSLRAVSQEKPGTGALSGGETSGREAFVLKNGGGENILKIRGVLQFDSFFFDQNIPVPTAANGAFNYAPTTFNPRKVRLYIEGTVDKYYDFRFLPDFGNGQTVLQDAYLDIHYWQFARLEGGKFKSPVGLERLQDEGNIEFFDRAMPTNLLPNRDVGFFVHGDPFDGAVSYALGVLNGVADNALLDTDGNNDKDGVARIFVTPFKNSPSETLNGLGLGIAGTMGNQNKATAASPNLPAYKTIGQTTFFGYAPGVVANGEHTRYSPQASYYLGPFGFLGEYAVSNQTVSTGANQATLKHSAWETAIYFVLTGEKASYSGIYPAHPFDPRNGQYGAIELAVRYSRLNIDPSTFPIYASRVSNAEGAKEIGGGVNWYLNKNVKIMLDYFDTEFDTAAGGTPHGDERAILTRFQLAF